MFNVVTSPDNSSTQPLSQDNDKVCGQEWVVVTSPRDATDTCTGGMSSRFDFQLGWGKWKFTLFSWDVNVKKGHTHSDEGSSKQQEQ